MVLGCVNGFSYDHQAFASFNSPTQKLYPTCLFRPVKALYSDIWRENADISGGSLYWVSKTLPGCRGGTTHQDSRSIIEIWLTLVFWYGPKKLKKSVLGQLWASVFLSQVLSGYRVSYKHWKVKISKSGNGKLILDPVQMACRQLLLRTLMPKTQIMAQFSFPALILSYAKGINNV